MRAYEYSDILINTDVAVYMTLFSRANELRWKSPFNMSIGNLASRSKTSISSTQRSRDRLEKAGLIKWESRGGRQSANYWIIEPQSEPQSEPRHEPQDELQHEHIHKTIKTIKTNDTNIYIRGKKFQKPTIEEIQNYLDEKNITSFTAEKFYNFYESKDWMIGKNKMKNWKACCNTWKGNYEEKKKKDEPKKDKYEHLYLGYNEKENKQDEPKTDEYADLYL